MIILKATVHHEGHQHAVRTRDISRTSIGLISDQPIDPGNVVRLDLVLPSDEVVNRQLEIKRCDERTGFYEVAGLFT
jgi:hypothetical protein